MLGYQLLASVELRLAADPRFPTVVADRSMRLRNTVACKQRPRVMREYSYGECHPQYSCLSCEACQPTGGPTIAEPEREIHPVLVCSYAAEARADLKLLEQKRRYFQQVGLQQRRERVVMQLQAHLDALRGLWDAISPQRSSKQRGRGVPRPSLAAASSLGTVARSSRDEAPTPTLEQQVCAGAPTILGPARL